MTIQKIPKFISRVSREGVVSSRDSFNGPPEPIDTANYQQDSEDSKQDRLDLQKTLDATIAEATALRDRLVALGPLGVVAYLHVRIAEGEPETLGAFNCRLGVMGAQLNIILLTAIEAEYTAVVHNQRSADNDTYYVDDRLARTLTIRAFDLSGVIGVPVDLSLDAHEFVLICRKLLPEAF